ncbi:MAG: phosphotransferase [Verrucomicrobia bacterium]|nr:phosphotransferase [Verrucomicrobiota bacterium]
MTPSEFRSAHPDSFYLDGEATGELQAYLHAAQALPLDDSIATVGKAGDGNMNCTLRVTSSAGRHLIVKQARPWVEKYPQFAAPWDRALREMEFYQLAGSDATIKAALPDVLHADAASRLLILEDLGTLGDCSDIYAGGQLSEGEVGELARLLARLHCQFQGNPAAVALHNREMRDLNHAHIFDIPFLADNGLDLDAIVPGLAQVAAQVREDQVLVERIHALGEAAYLVDSGQFPDTACLVHGDFFPGSFLRTRDGGLRVIDPEFCYGGRPEFDSGVFLAHLVLGQQSASLAQRFMDSYAPPQGHCEVTMLQLAGVEIIRRLLGYAQLPLAADLQQRKEMLDRARNLVLDSDRRILVG